MSTKTNFVLLAEYNQWMNQSVYEAASGLSIESLNADQGAYFKSILGTLNHILVGDTIWLKRFSDHPSQLASLDYVRSLQTPKALDVILYKEFETLRGFRSQLDQTINEFANQLSDEMLASPLSYRDTKGIAFTKNLGHLIQHFFNHQTHHRGQVTTLLSQAGIDVGVTDLLLGIPNE